MPLEDANFISELNPAWPTGSDGVNTADDHHRNTKKATQQSFPNISGQVTATQDDLNIMAGAAANGSPTNPVGTILQGYWTAAPNGYLACDGAAINALYTELISLVGASTPDLRGRFIRGWSANDNVDPDGPRAAGSQQSDAFEQHLHSFSAQQWIGGYTDDGGSPDQRSGTSTTNTNSAGSASETRPLNTALMFAIKW